MSSPITPMSDRFGPATTRTPSGLETQDGLATLVAELHTHERLHAIDAHRGAPPEEVLAQIEDAGRLQSELREGGHELRFSERAADGERVSIALHDADGNLLRCVSTVEAFEIAAGRPLG